MYANTRFVDGFLHFKCENENRIDIRGGFFTWGAADEILGTLCTYITGGCQLNCHQHRCAPGAVDGFPCFKHKNRNRIDIRGGFLMAQTSAISPL
jgi:hypothetical protein